MDLKEFAVKLFHFIKDNEKVVPFSTRAGIQPKQVYRLIEDTPSRSNIQRIIDHLTLPVELQLEFDSLFGESPTAPKRTLSREEWEAQLVSVLQGIRLQPGQRNALIDQLKDTIQTVYELWKSSDGLIFSPARGLQHCKMVIECLVRFFPEDLVALAPKELHMIIAASLLHDIGIAVHQGKELPDDELYLRHAALSADYVRNNYLKLGLSPRDRGGISELCRHYRTQRIGEVEIATDGEIAPQRLRGLIAMLQMAELLEVRFSRLAGRDPARLPFHNQDITADVIGEWLRNLFIQKVTRDGALLNVHVARDRDWPEEKVEQVVSAMGNEIRYHLDRLKEYLTVVARPPSLMWVEVLARECQEQDLRPLMETALGMLNTYRSPNASKIIDHFLSYLNDVVETKEPDRLSKLVGELDQAILLRPYHTQVRKLRNEVNNITDSTFSDSQKIDASAKVLQSFTACRKAMTEAVERFASSIRKEDCLLLFGLSDSVFQTLRAAVQSSEIRENTTILVMECRPKGIAGGKDFNEGKAQADQVKSLGFKKVGFIPDVWLASIFEWNREGNYFPPPPTKVLVGANAIDFAGNVYGVAGYLMIARLVQFYSCAEAPISFHVIAESGKIGDCNWLDQERRTSFLSAESGSVVESGSKVRVYRPLDDKVPRQLVSSYITEKGNLTWSALMQEFPSFPWVGAQ